METQNLSHAEAVHGLLTRYAKGEKLTSDELKEVRISTNKLHDVQLSEDEADSVDAYNAELQESVFLRKLFGTARRPNHWVAPAVVLGLALVVSLL